MALPDAVSSCKGAAPGGALGAAPAGQPVGVIVDAAKLVQHHPAHRWRNRADHHAFRKRVVTTRIDQINRIVLDSDHSIVNSICLCRVMGSSKGCPLVF